MNSPNNKFKLDFVGIGFPRAGTTWLWEALRTHPQVCMAKDKELFYFCKTPQWHHSSHYEWGEKWLESNFSHCKPHQIKGEISTMYISDASSPALIKQMFPNIKIIVNYRNPTERMHSLYHMMASIYPVPDTFEKFIDQGEMFIRTGFSYKLTQHFLDYFPIEQFKFVFLEDIEKHPLTVASEVYNFLGIDPTFTPPHPHIKFHQSSLARSILLRNFVGGMANFLRRSPAGNLINRLLSQLRITRFVRFWLLQKNSKVFSPPKMKEETRQRLISLFSEDIINLGKLVGRDLEHWNK